MSLFQLKREKILPTSRCDAWDFISRPENLKEITPDSMGFDILTTDLPENIYPGLMIAYKVKPLLGIPTKWVTEITHVKDQEFFVDEQRVGPYSLWHHEHILSDHPGGVLMKDIVTYKPPLGILGDIANAVFIKSKLNQVFAYRSKALDKLFPTQVD